MMLRRRRRRMATISLKSNDVRSKHGKQNKLLRWLNHSPSMAIGQPSLFVTVVTFTFWQLCSGEIFSITRLERKWLPNCYLIECIEWCANRNGEAVKQAWHNDPTELQCTNPQMDFCHRKSIWAAHNLQCQLTRMKTHHFSNDHFPWEVFLCNFILLDF